MDIKIIYDSERSRNGHDLYRHFDADGGLLYIGISSDVIRRLAEHAASSTWYRDIRKVTVERCDSIEDARAKEWVAIFTENPRHNKTCMAVGIEGALTRPKKARILEKFGLRYVACWLPAELVENLQDEVDDTAARIDRILAQPEVEATERKVEATLKVVSKRQKP